MGRAEQVARIDAMPANCLRWTDHRHPCGLRRRRRRRRRRRVIISRDWHTVHTHARSPPPPPPSPPPSVRQSVDCPNGAARAGGPINLRSTRRRRRRQSHLRRRGITNRAAGAGGRGHGLTRVTDVTFPQSLHRYKRLPRFSASRLAKLTLQVVPFWECPSSFFRA